MKTEEPLETLIAYSEDQAMLRMYLYRDPSATDNVAVRGWCFVADKKDIVTGDWVPIFDSWADTFAEIALYPPEYHPEPLLWTDEVSGTAYSLDELKRAIRS